MISSDEKEGHGEKDSLPMINYPITRLGTPAAVTSLGTSATTTDPAPIIESEPIFMPCITRIINKILAFAIR